VVTPTITTITRESLMYRTLIALFTLSLAAAGTLATTVDRAAAVEDIPSRVVLHDGTGDVWTVSGDGEEFTKTSYPTADVTRAVVKHGHYAIRIRMRFADLRRVGFQAFEAMIFNPRRGDDLASVGSGPGARQGTHQWEAGESRCRGFTHTINYDTNWVTMRIPRSCLGRPPWVKVSLYNFTSIGDEESSTTHYTDNPHNHKESSFTYTRRLYRAP
jgi:hypothetical protein